MMPLRRAAPPSFWASKEKAWLDRWWRGENENIDPLSWQQDRRHLSGWFHEGVRSESLELCAYCDGRLGEQSAATIDHFFPRRTFPALVLCWDNLYPACDACNEKCKGVRWSCHLLRPDADLVAGAQADEECFAYWFSIDPASGRLTPAPQAARRARARARLTIRVFGLNRPRLCQARLDAYGLLMTADEAALERMCRRGPYRFIALQVHALRQRRKIKTQL